MRAAQPVVIVVALFALLAGSTQAQEPLPNELPPVSKPDKLEATPLVDAGAVWSATMVVGQPSQSRGHAYVGYSYFKRSGALEPTGFDYRGERIRVLAVAYSATAHKLGLAVNAELASELALRVGRVEFAVADAALMRSRYVSHVVYEWDTTELDWAVGDSVDVAVAAPPTPVFDDSVLPARPNVVLILADDLGWGDVASNNPDSAMTTPNIDSIATAGVNFTDAHSPSSVCSPTRYSLLTGRHPWKSWLGHGVLGGSDRPMIGQGQPTLGTLLQQHGYRTAAVGKWHLGMEYTLVSDTDEITDRNRGIDFNQPILDGPIDHGFDEFFGTPANLRFSPRLYVRDDRFVYDADDDSPQSDGYVEFDEVLDRLTEEAVSFIERSSEDGAPFFLYLPLNAPHHPWQPNEQFAGSTGLGTYADFVANMDWSVGQVLDTLDEAGVEDDTLVIFTSDNGPSGGSGVPESNHVEHSSSGIWRDGKGSVYEGGHRVPLMMQWPAAIAPGSQVDATVTLTDLYSTLAEITGQTPEPGAAPDGVSLVPLLSGEATARGTPVAHLSQTGMFAVREGPWKLILGPGTGKLSSVHAPFSFPWQLYDLDRDPGEENNLIDDQPAVADGLARAYRQIRDGDDADLPGGSALRMLRVAGVDIGPFSPDKLDYEGTVGPRVWTAVVATIPAEADASTRVALAGTSADTNDKGLTGVFLPDRVNRIEATVTAADSSSTTTYTLTLTRVKDRPSEPPEEEAVPPANSPVAGLPRIAGFALEGRVLRADLSGVSDADGIQEAMTAYQWIADGEEIAGATDREHSLLPGDAGKRIQVKVWITDERDNTEALVSSAVVVERPPPLRPYRPEGLRAEAVDGAVRLRWVAPDGTGWVSNHLVWRHRPESGDPEPSEHAAETGSVARSFTDADVESGVLYEYRVQAVDLFGYTGELSEAVSVRVPAVAPSLTAEVSGVPSSHDGQSPLRFDLVFSEEPDLSYVTLRDHAFSVAGGEVVGARRLEPPSNLRWEITVVPAGAADVVVVLAPTADCDASSAICTGDGERLSSRIEIEIAGP